MQKKCFLTTLLCFSGNPTRLYFPVCHECAQCWKSSNWTVSDNRAVCLLFVTRDHSFLVEWCVQENNLFSLFIISIPVIAPLCCQWFIEEPFGKLGIKYSNNHLACKFPKHIHDCQNYYKNKLEEKENVFKTSDVLNSVTTSLRRPASSSGGVWHYRLTADINYQFSDSHLSIPPPPLLNRSISNLHSH